jgi:hypothetical protein
MTPIKGSGLLLAMVLAASAAARAQQFACYYTVRPGDTAASIALMLTGNADSRMAPSFQMLEPGASTFVSKAAYNAIAPGWRACVLEQIVQRRPLENRPHPSPSRLSILADLTGKLTHVDFDLVLWVAAGLMAIYLAAVADDYWEERQGVINVMKRFGWKFVREFEYPLQQHDATVPAILSRLRFMPHKGRLEVLLAPGSGHCYPNLSDHRRNVEYDVGRVLHTLRDESFINEPLASRGRWVVIPFRVKGPGRGVPGPGM